MYYITGEKRISTSASIILHLRLQYTLCGKIASWQAVVRMVGCVSTTHRLERRRKCIKVTMGPCTGLHTWATFLFANASATIDRICCSHPMENYMHPAPRTAPFVYGKRPRKHMASGNMTVIPHQHRWNLLSTKMQVIAIQSPRATYFRYNWLLFSLITFIIRKHQ